MPELAPDDVEDAGSRPEAELRVLRKKAAEFEAATAKVAELERREAFRTAGLDPLDPKTSYFVKGYGGDLSADAIRAEAEAAGFLTPPPPPAPDPSVQALGRVTSAAAGPSGGEAFPVAQMREKAAQWKSVDDVVKDLRAIGWPLADEE